MLAFRRTIAVHVGRRRLPGHRMARTLTTSLDLSRWNPISSQHCNNNQPTETCDYPSSYKGVCFLTCQLPTMSVGSSVKFRMDASFALVEASDNDDDDGG